ncbi:MAG: GC-type dockerin domain-anchored protein [Phycisphaerales bacterium JB039]
MRAKATAIALLTGAAAGQQYSPTDVGTLTDRTSSLSAINADGVVAGSSAVSGGSAGGVSEPWVLHGVVYDGTLRDLGVLGPDVPPGVFPKPESRASGVNGAGQVVGYSNQPGEPSRGFVWLPAPAYGRDAGMWALPELPGRSTLALDINDSGQIAGESRPAGSIGPHPVRWDFDPALGAFAITDLGTLGGPYGRARAINGQGQVAGQANVPSGDLRAFVHLPAPAWGMPAGLHELLPLIPTSSDALDINEAGQIVGVIGLMTPFVWLPEPAHGRAAGAHILPVAPIPDAVGAIARGINGRGEIVGDLAIEVLIGPPPGRPALQWHGCIWTDFVPKLLDDMIPQGWAISGADAINDAGQIAATGTGPGFTSSHGIILTPPCAADLTGDGALDLFDFLAFQTLYALGDPRADCDGSGALDVFDFLCYQNLFAAGCP